MPSRQETADTAETDKGLSEGRLSSLPGIAKIYGCPHWISTEPKKWLCNAIHLFQPKCILYYNKYNGGMVSADSNKHVEGLPSKKGACPTGHAPLKKEGCHLDNQSSINLKSNTMKNTVQRYGFSVYLQMFHG